MKANDCLNELNLHKASKQIKQGKYLNHITLDPNTMEHEPDND